MVKVLGLKNPLGFGLYAFGGIGGFYYNPTGYNNFGGVFVWEFFNAPPGKNPIDWAILINAVMKK